jgi:tetratricopeptide (TPR) repeat protein
MFERILAGIVSVAMSLGPTWAQARVDGSPDASTVERDAANRAETLAQAALESFHAGRFVEASGLLADAYALDPDPRYVYGQAQAEKAAGNCKLAIELYERYLEHEIRDHQAQAARTAIDACPVPTEPEPQADPVPAPHIDEEPVREPSQPPARVDEAPKRASWFRDPWGGVALGLGVGALGVGGGLYGQALVDRDAARATRSEAVFAERKRTASRFGTTGAVLMGVGSALLVAAVVRYAVLARQRQRARAR